VGRRVEDDEGIARDVGLRRARSAP
jgi:hypothetical protein